MWENSNEKNDDKYHSLRNTLKSFDPYAVLEPLTPQGIPKEDVLVDLTDTNNDSNQELSGSLLDKSTKSDFDVIDVFQNLFVTPQHVTKSKNLNGTSKDNKEWIKAFDGINHRNNDEIDIKKELESVFTNNATLTRLSDEFDVDIDEVLTMKRKEVIRSSQNDVGSTNYDDTGSNLYNNVKTKELNTDIVITNNLQANITPKLDKHEYNNTNFSFNKEYIFIDKSNNEAMKVNNFQMIKTIQLDKKKLQKKIVLPDDVKRNYTKGPDLIEKSIALPSMIERIKARQQLIDNEKGLKHRLILEPDCLSFVPIIERRLRTSYQFHPQVLTEDCMKQRLIALQAGKAFQKFVIGEK